MSIPLGPLALPAGPLLLWLAAWLSIGLARRLSPREATGADPGAGAAAADAGSVLMRATLLGLLAARTAFVAVHADVYGADPLAIIDVRDGGWHPVAGLAAGLCRVLWCAWRRAPWRKALAAGSVAGLAFWFAGLWGLGTLAPKDLPDVALQDMAGSQDVRLRDLATGRPVVVNLWATWCGPCRREMPVLAAAQARHPDVVFVFVNQGETADAVQRHLGSEGLGLKNVLLDGRSTLGPALGSRGLPTTVIFDGAGRRIDAHLGALNAAALAARLGSLEAP